ncbi:hypothetical protein ABZ922_42275 [Streptomyces shenzhenensis]|uniref:hypothetical protein n=1 Tax=Streptomyces shenzhenensis TaxID=943815 RepID=UPI0034020B0B
MEDESSAKPWAKHLARMDRWRTTAVCYLRKWIGQHGQSVQAQFLQGAAHRLGSGAVTLLILWWEARR